MHKHAEFVEFFTLNIEEEPKLKVNIKWPYGAVPDMIQYYTGETFMLMGKYLSPRNEFRYRRVVPTVITQAETTKVEVTA